MNKMTGHRSVKYGILAFLRIDYYVVSCLILCILFSLSFGIFVYLGAGWIALLYFNLIVCVIRFILHVWIAYTVFNEPEIYNEISVVASVRDFIKNFNSYLN